MIMRCGRQGWSPRRPNLICHNPSVTAIVSRVRVLLAHQGMSLPDALAPADVRLPVWVKMRRTLIEHMSAGLPLKADIAQRGWHGRKVPITDITPFIRSPRRRPPATSAGLLGPAPLRF
jgi:hypothetical protein